MLVSNVVGQVEVKSEQITGWYDPLAQSFLVEDAGGIFVTKCDVFFRTKDDMDIPCGIPNQIYEEWITNTTCSSIL